MFNFLNTEDPKANRNRLVILLIVVMFIGMFAGSTMSRVPQPTATTVTNTETKTPQSCLDYIEHSETGFGLAEEAMTYTADALEASGDFDLKGMNDATANLKSVKPKLDTLTPKLMQAKADCKASK